MAFQIKDFVSIAASMINWMKSSTNKIDDFNEGSVARTIVEAPAAEIDELYQQMFIGLREAIPVSVFNSFDFAQLPATPTRGMVRVTITGVDVPTPIPAGTVFSIPSWPVSYTSLQDLFIDAGDTQIDVSVVATVAGSVGNLSGPRTFLMTPQPETLQSSVSLAPFVTGTDIESADDRKIRFNAFIDSLNRGTVRALEYGLKTVVLRDAIGNELERVARVSVVEPFIDDQFQPVSLVTCYVHNGIGGTTPQLVLQGRKVVYGYYDENGIAVPGWKAAGVQVEVYAATEQLVPFTGQLVPQPGRDAALLRPRAVEVIYAYLLSLDIGVPAIKSEIVKRVMEIDGVLNIIPSAPSADVLALDGAGRRTIKLMPGAITIT